MSTQHTPGPWRIEQYTNASVRDGERIRASNNLITVNEVWGASLSECDANYRLIAAAPELLEACKQLLEAYFEEHYAIGGHEAVGCTYCDALAAIAKAEGSVQS